MSSRGQVVLPAEIRKRDGIEVGQEFDVERIAEGEYRLVRRDPPPNHGFVDWLCSCPEDDWFAPVDSESTDDL